MKTTILCLGLLAGFSATSHAGVPADFRVELRSAPRVPGEPAGAQEVAIDAQGRVKLAAVQGPDETLPALETQLKPDAVQRIYDAVTKDRFFELKPLYREPKIRDGDYARMTITAEGRTHTVKTVNIRVFAFDRIVITIDRELPKGRRIQYNALHVKSYPEVER
jgi:hypothetical protein